MAKATGNKVIRLEDELFRREQQIALFKEVVSAVRERLDLDQIFRMVAVFAQGLIKAETVLVPVLDDGCASYTYRAGCGVNAEEIVGESLDINLGICGWVWKHQRPWWHGVLDDLSEEERNQWEKEVGSVILVPLVGRNHFLGGIAGINKIGKRDFDQSDLDLLTLLASQVAIAIDNNSLLEELESANHALLREKEKIQVTLSSIGDAVITTDVQGRVEYLNPAAERIFATGLEQAKGRMLTQLGTLLLEESRLPAGNPVEHALREGRLPAPLDSLILARGDDGEIFVKAGGAPIRDPEGHISGVVLVLRDESRARELADQLSHQATHDALTGLFNRTEFEYRIRQAIHDAQVTGNSHALLHLDIDQFKVINDTCGHFAGDQLLKELAGRLAALLRPEDALARLGGDEFGILLSGSLADRALPIAEAIRTDTQNFRFHWEDKTFAVGVSMGLIEIDRGSQSVIHVSSRVDAACQMAKEEGRNRIYVHDEKDLALHRRHGQMEWTPRILRALEEQRMVLHCQPIVGRDAPGALASHYEILIRMVDESGGLVPPGTFLPAAERYNLITAVDRWVVTAYFRWLAEHPAHLATLELGSLNLSGRSLGDDGCLLHIEQALRDFAIPPEKICFEITETEAVAHLDRATGFIGQLRDLGCRFALDDFGSGFSSYAYLKNLPVDFLKIDGMFVKDVASDPTHYAMVDSINHIGHVMGRKTIAEFVENEAIRQTLYTLGIDYMQGYGIAMPHPLADLG